MTLCSKLVPVQSLFGIPLHEPPLQASPSPIPRIQTSHNKAVWKYSLQHNRPFAGSGHMARYKLCWDTNNVVGLAKLGWTGTGSFVLEVPLRYLGPSKILLRTMRPDPTKGILSV